MLGSTLASVLNLVKSEIRASLSSGSADDALLKQSIETWQEWLATEYEWAELKDQWDKVSVVGLAGRYLTFPTVDVSGNTHSINFDRDVKLMQKYNNTWVDVTFGITPEDYNSQDSDEGESQDPILKWDFKPGDRASFEVWPLPVVSSTLRFFGQRKLTSLRTAGVLDTTKTLDLDDQIVALAVAVDYLSGKPEQATKKAKFETRFNRIRGGNKKCEERHFMGGQPRSRREFRRVPIITTA